MDPASSQLHMETPSPVNITKEITNYENRGSIILVVVIISLLLLIFGLIAFIVINNNANSAKTINSFEECEAAGNVVMESFPRQCKTKDGKLFIEEIEQPQVISSPIDNNEIVNLFFSQDPESYNNPLITVKVERETVRNDLEIYSIEELIKGPNENEQITQRLFSEIDLSGTSNCDNKDFTLSIDDQKEAVLKFCRELVIAGTLSEARIKEMLSDTLLQFKTIETIVMLDKKGEMLFNAQGF